MSEQLKDPMFWYTVAFVIFFILVLRYGRKPIFGWLDGEILKIRDELANARKLRAEAEATLASYKTKHAQAMADAEMIVRHAKDEALRVKEQAETDLKNALARHEQQAAERIRLTESEALIAVRTAAIDMAMAIAHATLAQEKHASLTDEAIAELPKLALSKAKAA